MDRSKAGFDILTAVARRSLKSAPRSRLFDQCCNEMNGWQMARTGRESTPKIRTPGTGCESETLRQSHSFRVKATLVDAGNEDELECKIGIRKKSTASISDRKCLALSVTCRDAARVLVRVGLMMRTARPLLVSASHPFPQGSCWKSQLTHCPQ